MDWAWRIALATVGMVWLRTVLYTVQWGHGGAIKKILGLIICGVLIWPLAEFSPDSHAWLLAAGAIWLFPYRQLAIAMLRRTTVAAARRLALEWGTTLKESGDLWEASAENRWMGNVLTRARSLHPGVSTAQTYYMLGFSVRLVAPPSFQCSIMKGWSDPKYFAVEWRETTTLQGEVFAMSFGQTLDDGGRKTGGDPAELAEWELPDPRFGSFFVRGSGREQFDRVFTGELLDVFFGCAALAAQFEMNVTPTSVNIYTVYGAHPMQRRNVDFLQRLAGILNPSASPAGGHA